MTKPKTRRTRRIKRRIILRRKNKSQRRGRGKDDENPFIKTMLNKIHLGTDKEQYEERLKQALVLNRQILQDQEEAIKKIEQSGRDGPARRTRSKNPKKKETIDPELLHLKIERDFTVSAIASIQYQLQRISEDRKPGPGYIRPYIPYGFTNYADALKFENRPYFDKERMVDARRDESRYEYYV